MARIGPPGSDGKPTQIVLRGPNGKPLGKDDEPLVAGAIARQKKELSEAIATEAQPPKVEAIPVAWTLADVFREYQIWAARKGRRPKTRETVAYRLKVFLAFTGNKLAEHVNAEDWFRFEESPGGAKPQIYESVRAALHWASRPVSGRVPVKVIPTNPFDDIQVEQRKADWLPALEWSRTRSILRTVRAYSHAVKVKGSRRRPERVHRWLRAACITFQAYTGCRTAEAITLTWKEIDLAAGVVRLDPDRVKTGKRRALPIGRCRRLLEAIQRLPDREGNLVFWPSARVTPNRQHYRWLTKVRKWAAVQRRPIPDAWVPYDLRRGWATDAIEAIGVDRAAAVLGHSPEVLRAIYDRPGDRRAIESGDEVQAFRAKRRAK